MNAIQTDADLGRRAAPDGQRANLLRRLRWRSILFWLLIAGPAFLCLSLLCVSYFVTLTVGDRVVRTPTPTPNTPAALMVDAGFFTALLNHGSIQLHCYTHVHRKADGKPLYVQTYAHAWTSDWIATRSSLDEYRWWSARAKMLRSTPVPEISFCGIYYLHVYDEAWPGFHSTGDIAINTYVLRLPLWIPTLLFGMPTLAGLARAFRRRRRKRGFEPMLKNGSPVSVR